MSLICELLVFDQVDLLDVGGPYEVLLTANRLAERDGDPPPFEVRTVAAGDGPVSSYGGLQLGASHDLGDEPTAVFLVPGAVDVDGAIGDGRLLDVIAAGAQRAELVASVCTGAVLLARAAQLEATAAATTHHEDLDVLAAAAPGTEVHRARWVDTGRTVTAGGLSSGIALALHLVDRLHSRALAVRTAAQIAYDWDPDDGIDLRVGT